MMQATHIVVWVPCPNNSFVKARLLSSNPSIDWKTCNKIRTRDVVTAKEVEWDVTKDRVLEYDVSHDKSVDDLCNLNRLNEAAVLNTIRMRFQSNLIYTLISPLVISMNPYRDMPEIYNIATWKAKREPEKAHVFFIAQECLEGLSHSNHSIVVRGESGAGKTETCKKILQFLTHRDAEDSNSSEENSGKHHLDPMDVLKSRILSCSPILESFGNAATQRNDNSSRFGKYLRILFDGKVIYGADMIHYLLERSRVVSQQNGERNYHIFYQLIYGLSEDRRETLRLSPSADYRFISKRFSTIPHFSDGCNELVTSLEIAGIDESSMQKLFEVVSAILHLGNITFSPHPTNELACVVDTASAAFEFAQSILQVSDLSSLLNSRSIVTSAGQKESRIKVDLNVEKSMLNTEALAKDIFEKIFAWLIGRCNALLAAPRDVACTTYIALLDLFGFEDFDTNNFEQFCINYGNEKLQSVFCETIFEDEIKLYMSEGLSSKGIGFNSNAECLELLEGPRGIFKLLDEQCSLRRSAQQSQEEAAALLKQITSIHAKKNSHLVPQRNTSKSRLKFTIRHYAGDVEYIADNFISKNLDRLEGEFEQALRMSACPFIAELYRSQNDDFASKDVGNAHVSKRGAAREGDGVAGRLTSLASKLSATNKSPQRGGDSGGKKVLQTISTKFR